MQLLKRQHPPHESTSGFTIVELMVALVVLGVGICPVGSLFVFSQHHSAYSPDETVADPPTLETRVKIPNGNLHDLTTTYASIAAANVESSGIQAAQVRLALSKMGMGRGEEDDNFWFRQHLPPARQYAPG
ncbi:prepilin-type N-terminal cleavage/methylation domain-containing protein [Candidatus Eisenbacteria bacterium]|uniref:Prepilin-type N-terminal cleavage/methylation domain-containing protein n=1 Tax=Eiseniibacteriota bacterium TaxID=2212470 RepID=A0ABV6YLI4_UNCEI